jgi:hypothetical protein
MKQYFEIVKINPDHILNKYTIYNVFGSLYKQVIYSSFIYQMNTLSTKEYIFTIFQRSIM